MIDQLDPKGFILVSNLTYNMVEVTKIQQCAFMVLRERNIDAKQHWFLCKSIWREKRVMTPNTKLVEFQATLRGEAL
jgi:hypothetical protein